MTKVGVLVMAHGTPASAAEIEPFYTRIRRGRPPSPEELADLERRYAAIGGVSPLTERTRAQVDDLRAELERRDAGRFAVQFGAKHVPPFIEDAMAVLAAAGSDPVLGLVLTPHASSMGSGEYHDRARAVAADRAYVEVPAWFDRPGFVAVMASRLTEAVAAVAPDSDDAGLAVVFTAHSLPERVRASGDTYPEQLETSARLVGRAAGVAAWTVAWQSAGRTPEPWLGPDVRDEIRRLAADGASHVLVCPIGFVSDHLEVLYDLDVEAAAVAAECGVGFSRTASLNADARFITVLADAVEAASPRS